MSQRDEQKSVDEERWKHHVFESRASGLSDVEYCRQNGLKLGTFGGYKKKLGFVKPRLTARPYRRNAFVRAVTPPVSTEPVAPSTLPTPSVRVLPSLPDPAWLAKFIHALGDQQ